jgi:large subunit ribosomal protein L9e
MKLLHSSDTVSVPDDGKSLLFSCDIYLNETNGFAFIVTVSVKSRVVTVEGKYGKLVQAFKHIPVDLKLTNNNKLIKVEMWFSTSTQRACIRTLCSHIKNMIIGVSKKFQYKMRLVYAHFPINATITNDNSCLEVRNFMGEKKLRKVSVLESFFLYVF